MKLLALECSASPASVAVIEGGKIISSSFVNVKLTHSQTLLPMIENALKAALLKINDVGGIAVTVGPGSFTGIRIGISVAKGLAAPFNLPCAGVSTLEAMSYMFLNENVTVCAVMDARCNQLYNALFKVENGIVTRLCDDRAIISDHLADEIKNMNENIVICGDGADLFYKKVSEYNNVKLASPNLKFQSAVGVGLLAEKEFNKCNTIMQDSLLPVYLRMPQAERELKSKLNQRK